MAYYFNTRLQFLVDPVGLPIAWNAVLHCFVKVRPRIFRVGFDYSYLT